MLMTMLNFDDSQWSLLVIVIEEENLDRMKKADPITLESLRGGGIFGPPKYPDNFSLMIAHEVGQDELYVRAKGDLGDFIQWLERGRRWIPGKDGKQEAYFVKKGK